MSASFHVGISQGLALADERSLLAREALALFDSAGITYDYFTAPDGEVRATDIAGCDGLVLLGERFSYPALDGNDRLIGVARWQARLRALLQA